MPAFFNRLAPYELAINGYAYAVPFYVEFSGNETKYVQIKTGAKDCLVLNYKVTTSDEPLKITVLENPTVTVGTQEVPSYKLNRSKSGNAVTKFYSNPTNISLGTAIFYDVTDAGKHSGGGLLGADHWTLKQNEDYLWKFEQLTNSATKVAGMLVFTEDYGDF